MTTQFVFSVARKSFHCFSLSFLTNTSEILSYIQTSADDMRGSEAEMYTQANCLYVTRFIMLAPIAHNTFHSFRGVIHRCVITNTYCGSAEARARAQIPQISCATRIDILSLLVVFSLFLTLSSQFQFRPCLFPSRSAGK